MAEMIGERDWSNASLTIITLKDLHRPRHGSHPGLLVIAGHRAPPVDHHSKCVMGGIFTVKHLIIDEMVTAAQILMVDVEFNQTEVKTNWLPAK